MIKIYKKFFVHYSALLIAACMALKGNFDTFGLVLFSVVLHECGHLAALVLCREHADSLVLHAFGIEINTCSGNIPPKKMLAAVLAGPICSLIFGWLFYFLYPPLSMPNLCIGFINLLPVIPLDGGRLLYPLLIKICGRKSSKLIMRTVGLFVGSIASVIGTEVFFNSEYNFSLLLLGIFIIVSAFGEPLGTHTCFVREKAVLGEIYLLPQGLSVQSAAELLPSDSIGAVVDPDGKINRLVTSKELFLELAGGTAANTLY